MFSLVTALVSPCVIDLLANKKEALIATLQENASVVCSHPADSVCLLQGEWENVKKAYAIVEEFYLRTQAETAVRRVMKTEPGNGDTRSDFPAGSCGMIGGRIPPDQVLSQLLSPPPTDEGEQAAVGKAAEPHQSGINSHRSPSPDVHLSASQRMCLLSQSATLNGIASTEFQRSAIGSTSHSQTVRSQDDSPPILSREGNVDEISDESDTSESQSDVVLGRPGNPLPSQNCQLQNPFSAHVSSPREPFSLIVNSVAPSSTVTAAESVMPDSDEVVSSSRRLEHPVMAPASSDRCPMFPGGDPYGRSIPHQHAHRPIGSQHSDTDGPMPRLPQIASLFAGVSGGTGSGPLTAAAAAAAWPYAELYSAHLSAMRSICESTVKRESTMVDAPGYIGDRIHSSSGGTAAGYRSEDDPLAPEMRCSRCDKTYRSEARMREHARTHDAGYVAVLHSCPKCGKAFTYRHNMVVHLRRFHYGWQPAKRHACRTCGMRFQKPYLLRLHERKAHVSLPMDGQNQLAFRPT